MVRKKWKRKNDRRDLGRRNPMREKQSESETESESEMVRVFADRLG